MAADIPTIEPSSLRSGDTWTWTKTLDDYPATAWTLKYRFKSAAGGFEIVATASGSDHAATVAAATSAGYAAGSYTWVAWVEGGTAEKYTVGQGSTEILPDYRNGLATVALDDRSHAAKTLAAIEAWIEGRDQGVAEYEIAGRRMKFRSSAEILDQLNHWKSILAAEKRAERIAAGLGGGNKVLVRF